MSSTEHHRGSKARRKINPATCSVSELLSHLGTDPSAGLSPKEAERRLSLSQAKPLFRADALSFPRCLRTVIREPALWLLLVVSVISLFFDRVALGLVCLLLTLGRTALAAYLLWRSERVAAAMDLGDAPFARVLRGGSIRRVGASELVKGDLILLYPGDLVPADARLLSSEGLSVTERMIRGDDGSRTPHRLKKDASAIPSEGGGFRLSPVNMVFAGGVVEEGQGLALVVAVGSESHLGGLTGGIRSANPERLPLLLRNASKGLSTYNLIMLCLLIPLTALGILTLSHRFEMLDIFLAALAPAVLFLSEHIMSAGRAFFYDASRRAALERDTVNSACVKSPREMELLTAVTDLVILGTAALHDGCLHPETLRVGEQVYRCDRGEADGEAVAVTELLSLLLSPEIILPSNSVGYGGEEATLYSIIPRLCQWAETDTEGFSMKAKELRPEGDGVSAILPTPDGNRRLTVTLRGDFDAVRSCDTVYDSERGLIPAQEAVNRLYREHRNAIRTGWRTAFVILSDKEHTTLRAMITYGPHTCRKTVGYIRSLESAGIRVTALLREADDEHIRVLAECGLTEGSAPHKPDASTLKRKDASALPLMEQGCRAVLGCSDDFIANTVEELKREGSIVAVLSVDKRDLPILNAVHLPVTCAPALYQTLETGHPTLQAVSTADPRDMQRADGSPSSSMATDLCRRRAGILVRRSQASGGGVGGFRRAVLEADRVYGVLRRALSYLAAAQCARLVTVLIPLLLGLTVTAAPAILFSGLLLDTVVVLALTRLPVGEAPLSRRFLSESLLPLHRTVPAAMISAAASMGVLCLTLGVLHFLGRDPGGDAVYVCLLGLFSLQIAVFRTEDLPRRNSPLFLATLLLVLVYAGALGVALAAGINLVAALLFPLISPAVYVPCKLILNRFCFRDPPSR